VCDFEGFKMNKNEKKKRVFEKKKFLKTKSF